MSLVASLILVFFIGKNIPAAYSQSVERGIIYYDGYFVADNGIFGGPQCGVCLKWVTRGKGKNKKTVCVLRRAGITGYFTEDSACRAAYGSGMPAEFDSLRFTNGTQINVCDYNTSKAYKLACILPTSAIVVPTSLPPPCAEWKDGVCKKVDTSLLQGGDKSKGSMPVDTTEFVVRIFTIILSFAGGIALLLVISAGYKLLTSKGKPEAIQQGRDQLISAIVGLVFIIFSFVIFQLVFVDILKILGFT